MNNYNEYNENITKINTLRSKMEHLKSGRDLFDDPKEFWSQLKGYKEQLTDCAIEYQRLVEII